MNTIKLLLVACFAPILSGQEALAAAYPVRITVSPGTKAAAVYELPPPEDAVRSYDTVLINGVMPDANVKLRFGSQDPAASEIFPGGRFWAKYKVPAGEPLRVSVMGSAAASEHVVTIYNAEVFTEADQKDAASAASGREPGESKAISFPIIWRAGWGAVPVSGYAWHTPRKFTLHHTAGPAPADRAAAEAEMRFIQSQHRNGNGWLDIGYHFIISPQGDIFEGRPVNAVGAHVANNNTDNVGISVMGNYMGDQVTPEILDAIARVGQYLKADYRIGEGGFFAHRQLGPTLCPGDNLYDRMAELKGRIFRRSADPALARDISADPSFDALSPEGAPALGQLLGAASLGD